MSEDEAELGWNPMHEVEDGDTIGSHFGNGGDFDPLIGYTFDVGDYVEKFIGEAIWSGWIVSRYRKCNGKPRYVVEIDPQGFQMIATPSQLRKVESLEAE